MQAWKLQEQGWQQKEIARALGVCEGAVSQWLKRGREGGVAALKAHPPTGMPPRLTAEQKGQIPGLLAKGAEAYGFRGDVWTASRVAEVIARTFGVRYHRDHVGRLLREAGWSRQQPIERASQRNEEAIKQWSEQRWPAVKKSRAGPSYHRLGRRSRLLSVADGGAHLGTTWADAGAAGAVDARSSLLHQRHHLRWALLHASAFDLVRCRRRGGRASRVLMRKIAGKLVVIWDGSPIHRRHEIKDFLKRGAAKRLHLEQLPGYAPELNPDEGIWNDLKRVELGNVCCSDLTQLQRKLIQAKERLRHKKEVIKSCSRQCGYSV